MNYYICALIVMVASLLIFFSWQHSRIKGVGYFHFCLLLSLPLSAIVNLFIKAPIFSQLDRIFNMSEEPTQWPMWFHLIGLIVGALAEEVIKIVPLLLIIIRKVSLDNVSIYYLGLLLGVGFGIGEAWYLGYSFSMELCEYNSGLKNLLLLLSGFGGERLFTVFIHGFLTAGVTYGILLKKPIIFFLLMVLLHSLINFPALLYQLQKIPGEIAGILTLIIFCVLLFSVFLKIGDKVIMKWGKSLQKGDEVLYERKE